jgi:hypothetical protein
MKRLYWIVPALALALAGGGCVLVSGQFLVDFELDDMDVSTPTQVASQYVDLNTNSDYDDHKDELEGIKDLAVLGTLVNTGSTTIGVQIYITADSTAYTTASEVTSNATLLWGPFNVSAGDSVKVTWAESQKLFNSTGKTLLLNQVKGDGTLTAYAISDTPNYSFDVHDGVLALVLEFAK